MLRPASPVADFLSPRGGGNSWAQRSDVIEAWKNRDIFAVPPLAVEFAPLIECNANCALCPYARSRRRESLGLVPPGSFPLPNDVTNTSLDTAWLIVDRVADAGVHGILWTGGGEPTIWSPLLPAMRHSAERGLLNAIYTNGFQLGLDDRLAERLLDPEHNLVFARMSINAVSPRAVKLHWGVEVAEQKWQWLGLERLFAVRERLLPVFTGTGRPVPSIQVSTILDKNNIGDLLAICERVAEIAAAFPSGRGPEDVMIVRPLTIHGRAAYAAADHTDRVPAEILRICGREGVGRRLIEAAGFRLFLGFSLDRLECGEFSSLAGITEQEYAQRDVSWSNGVFLTIGPGGVVYFSTAKNCDPQWALGDLRTQSVAEVYDCERRRDFIEHANRLRWGPTVEQPTARSNRLDRIARAIIRGELNDATIEDIRHQSLTSHRLLLD
jgi:hypothetical protein